MCICHYTRMYKDIVHAYIYTHIRIYAYMHILYAYCYRATAISAGIKCKKCS